MPFDLSQVASLVAEANLAPSVHNTQPARWRFLADGRCQAYEDSTRRLGIADTGGRDACVSVGAAVEGMNLALSRRGLALHADPDAGSAQQRACEDGTLILRWSGRVERATHADGLAAVVERRATFRGVFRPADGVARERLSALAQTVDDAVVLTDTLQIKAVAAEHDAVSLGLLRNVPYRAELVSWMRFSARHPQWALDGLNAEAMSMSRAEAIGARVVLSNSMFPILDRLHLARPLTAERGRILSATALVLFHRPQAEDPVVTGRRFYRLWLTFTEAGFDSCPMSALADDTGAAQALCSRHGIGRSRRLINVFRVGIRPYGTPIVRSRLPAASLIVPSRAVKAT